MRIVVLMFLLSISPRSRRHIHQRPGRHVTNAQARAAQARAKPTGKERWAAGNPRPRLGTSYDIVVHHRLALRVRACRVLAEGPGRGRLSAAHDGFLHTARHSVPDHQTMFPSYSSTDTKYNHHAWHGHGGKPSCNPFPRCYPWPCADADYSSSLASPRSIRKVKPPVRVRCPALVSASPALPDAIFRPRFLGSAGTPHFIHGVTATRTCL